MEVHRKAFKEELCSIYKPNSQKVHNFWLAGQQMGCIEIVVFQNIIIKIMQSNSRNRTSYFGMCLISKFALEKDFGGTRLHDKVSQSLVPTIDELFNVIYGAHLSHDLPEIGIKVVGKNYSPWITAEILDIFEKTCSICTVVAKFQIPAEVNGISLQQLENWKRFCQALHRRFNIFHLKYEDIWNTTAEHKGIYAINSAEHIREVLESYKSDQTASIFVQHITNTYSIEIPSDALVTLNPKKYLVGLNQFFSLIETLHGVYHFDTERMVAAAQEFWACIDSTILNIFCATCQKCSKGSQVAV